MYTLGTYLIGIGASQGFDGAVAHNPLIWVWLIYFTFPANILIYGINDIGDTDTDTFNTKKGTYEVKIDQSNKKAILTTVVLSTLIFTPLAFFSSRFELVCFGLLILFTVVYSLKPIRLKAFPFVDSISNGVWCVIVGVMGYVAAGGENISFIPCLAGGLWASIMHAYSAIPDIEADTKAGIRTIATVLGVKKTLLVCLVGYIIIGVLFYEIDLLFHSFLVIPYIVLILISLKKMKQATGFFSIYKIYPYITYIVGPLVYALNVHQ